MKYVCMKANRINNGFIDKQFVGFGRPLRSVIVIIISIPVMHVVNLP